MPGSLAGEYGLSLVYKKAFHEILAEEQSSRDFGPLLGKMGVVNQDGASNMDEDQWEAASTSSLIWIVTRFELTPGRFVHGLRV